MILATGGLAFGATKTKSNSACSAKTKASFLDLTPSWLPSLPIKRTSRARIPSLTILSTAMVFHLQKNSEE